MAHLVVHEDEKNAAANHAALEALGAKKTAHTHLGGTVYQLSKDATADQFAELPNVSYYETLPEPEPEPKA